MHGTQNPTRGRFCLAWLQDRYIHHSVSTRATREERVFLTSTCDSLLRKGWLVDDDFAPSLVPKLREEFVSRFNDPLNVSADRFIWDYWHVPDQYSLMRTTAEAFFSETTYQLLEQRILEWAATLGCRSCSPMWVSYYVDSHAQQLHTDAPHGPFAFVLSITDFENRRFRGGETQLLKQETVLKSFWEDAGTAKEVNQLFDFIEPRFGRLAVFDGRIPHGVREVRGVHDPRESRVVIHGWFTEPTPYFEDGDINEQVATEILNGVLQGVFAAVQQLPPSCGVLVVRLQVAQDGSVESIDVLSCTLQAINSDVDRFDVVDGVLDAIDMAFDGATFAEAGGPGGIVLPFVFD